MGPFDAYKGSLPYASELFGIYQPLLGWKSQITLQRYARARESLYADLVDAPSAAGPPPSPSG